jgi:hypothetical protein
MSEIAGIVEIGRLLPGIDAPIVIADKGYDADERVLQALAQAGKTAVIPVWPGYSNGLHWPLM